MASPASFTAALTEGTEYTVEISRGDYYQYPIGNTIPNVEIINPQGNALNFDVSDSAAGLNPDVIELSAYPDGEPYIICFTFTPAKTGSYTIKLSQAVSDDIIYDDITLFIYKELRNEDGEAGYYKRYKFKDADGNLSETIKINDILALIKAYNDIEPLLGIIIILSEDESFDIDDYELDSVDADTQAQVYAYFETLYRIRNYYGIFDLTSEDQDVTIVEDESADQTGEEVISNTVSTAAKKKTTKKPTSKKPKKIISKGKLNAGGTEIPSELYGIPYTDQFAPGRGYFAITGVKSQNDAVQPFKLAVPKEKSVQALYKATFVSSQEEREKLSTTTTGASVAIGGFGISANYTGSSSFKFGLTSTTFVIHYEEVETAYRMLDNSQYKLNTGATAKLRQGSVAFQKEYGDYFAAGYKYGGTYDAFIRITTRTTEQLDKVKTELNAQFGTDENAVKAEVGKETSDFLKQHGATIEIEIRTAGIDDSDVISTETDDISKVSSTLQEFRQSLKNTDPKNYHPVYVMLKRYRLLTPVLTRMDKDGDTGFIPIKPAHSTKIKNFNRDFLIMDSYYNIIADADALKMNAEVKNSYKREYDDIKHIIDQGSVFYRESNLKQMEEIGAKIQDLSGRLKAVGDRYVFYQILMLAQEKERNSAQGTDINYKPFGLNGGYVGRNSFGVSKAVTSDIAAGKGREAFRFYINQFTGKTSEPSFDAGSGYVFCYIKVIAANKYDNERRANIPCVGTRTASFYFECGVARWLQWEVEAHSMRFTPELYPFTGLN